MGWYITIAEEMRTELGLTGNALIVFAVIAGYSQQHDGCCYARKANLAERCGVSKRTLDAILRDLEQRGLISSGHVAIDGEPRLAWSIAKGCNFCTPVQNLLKEGANPAPIKESIYKNINLSHNARESFKKPSVDEVAQYCADNGLDVDAQRFVDFYASKGWKVGSSPMKDWHAAARNWAARNASESNQRKAAPAKKADENESVAEHNRKVAERLLGKGFQI